MTHSGVLSRLADVASAASGKLASRTATATGLLLTAATLLSGEALAQAAGNTIGGRMTAASQDLTTGGGYVLELFGYILGGAALIAGGYTLWQHTKNPNGQHRVGYGIASILAGGFFLTASLIASFSSNTISGGNSTNTGTAQQLTFQ